MTASLFVSGYPIGRFSGRCARCGQTLEPGQTYYAVIWNRGREYVRQDYDENCWQEPQEQILGAWRAKVPAPQRQQRRSVPSELLMEIFERLADTDDEAGSKLRFVLALLLMRRRQLKRIGTGRQNSIEVWRLIRSADQTEFTIPFPELGKEDLDRLSLQLADLLAGLEEQADALP